MLPAAGSPAAPTPTEADVWRGAELLARELDLPILELCGSRPELRTPATATCAAMEILAGSFSGADTITCYCWGSASGWAGKDAINRELARGDHPWIEQNPRATVVVIVLRRIAYTLLSLWRGVTLRSDEQRTRPWRDVMRDILLAAVTATAEHLHALRRHRLAPVATLPPIAPAPASDSRTGRRGPRSAHRLPIKSAPPPRRLA